MALIFGKGLTDHPSICIKERTENKMTGAFMKKQNFRLHVVAALALCGVSAAYADYKDLDAENFQKLQAGASVSQGQAKPGIESEDEIFAARRGKLTQVGASKGTIHNVRGFGKELPFGEALRFVAPTGWNAKRVGAVDLGQPVVFGLSGSWLEAASSFARQTGTEITVDWETNLITVRGAQKAVSSTGFIKLAGGEDAKKSVSDMKALPPTNWTLKEGKSLRENIEEWASLAKWRVSWQSANYMITAPAAFTGAFDDETNGPVATLIGMFSKSDVPLKATFMEDNKVLVVENVGYKQDQSKVGQIAK
jgi:hypothetical protein